MLKLVGPQYRYQRQLVIRPDMRGGQKKLQDELNKIPPEKISSINIMKGES